MSGLGEYLKPRIGILTYLFVSPDITQNYSIKIAKELKIPSATVHDNISMLHKKRLLKVTRSGKMKFYELTQDGVSEVMNFLDLLQPYFLDLIEQHHERLKNKT